MRSTEFHNHKIYDNGTIIKISTNMMIKPYKSGNSYIVTMYYDHSTHTHTLKNLIGELFNNFVTDETHRIINKDGNPKNCSADNLELIEVKPKGRVGVVCISKDGKVRNYESISFASEATGMNKGTISYYISSGHVDKEGRLWTKKI